MKEILKEMKEILKDVVFQDPFLCAFYLILAILGISAIVALVLTILGITIPYPNEW